MADAILAERQHRLSASSIDLELANPAFTGPLGLLLDLIESRRLPITDVSLAEVADQYLGRMRSLVGMDPDILSDFLVIGAHLLVIKSRALLPGEQSKPEEIDDVDDLQQRLLEYRIFRDAAEALRKMEESGRRSYQRQPSPEGIALPEPPLEPIEPQVLRDAMVRMLRALRPEAAKLQLSPRVSVQERIEHLVVYLSRFSSAIFSDVAGNSVDAVVATFLALLELIRRGSVSVVQESPFAEIRISLAAPGS